MGDGISGFSANGLPCFRTGKGTRRLVIFEGINFVHSPPSGMRINMLSSQYKSFSKEFRVYNIGRKPGLPQAYSIRDMSEDYAEMIKNEIGLPVDLMGISTGGPMALQLTHDHPEMVRKLVLASTGYALSASGARYQRKIIAFAGEKKWRQAAAVMAAAMSGGMMRGFFIPMAWLMGSQFFGKPSDPSDGLVELEAEDRFNFKDFLTGIKVPTLVIGGEKDGFYPISETAAGIPGARAAVYKNSGHMAMMKSGFNRRILDFLLE